MLPIHIWLANMMGENVSTCPEQQGPSIQDVEIPIHLQ